MTGEAEPKRSRRGARVRRRLSVAIAVVASLAIVFVIYSKSRFLPNRVSDYVNEHYLKGTPFEFRCGRISGDFVNRIVVENPVLRYHSDEASFNVFRADEIAVDYRLIDVLKFDLIVDDLQAHNVRVQIRRDPDGALVLPLPLTAARDPASRATGARVDVQRFEIDGLQVLFGSGDRELAVRDVNVAGSFELENSVGRLQIEQGSAYLANTGTSVSSIRLDVEHDGGDLRVNEFVVRLDRSFVMATGGYRDDAFDQLRVVFNPISLDEVHQMGLIPDLRGEFGGSVVLEGPIDSLGVSGTVTGAGLGLAVSGLSFEGTATAESIDLARVDGDVYGSRLRGEFFYRLRGDHDYTFDGECAALDLTRGFVTQAGVPQTYLGGRVRLEHVASTSTYRIEAELDTSVVGGYESMATSFVGAWSRARGLVVREWRMERPGYTLDVSGEIRPDDTTDLLFRLDGHDLGYFWRFAGLPAVEGTFAVSGRGVGALRDLQVNLNGDVRGARYLFAAVDTAKVSADLRGVGGPSPTASVDLLGNRIAIRGRAFERPHLRIDASGASTVISDISFARGDTTFTADLEIIDRDDDVVDVVVRHASVSVPADAWHLYRPARLRLTPGGLDVDSLVLASTAGRVGFSGGYSRSPRAVDMACWGENVDLAMIRDATGVRVRLEGRAAFRVEARGDVDRPAVSCKLSARGGAVDSVSFDRVEVDASYDGTEYKLDRLHVVEGADSIDFRGWWRASASPTDLMRGGVDWAAMTAAPFRAEVDGHGYPVASLGRALHRPVGVGGALHGAIVFTGSPDAPRVDVSAATAPRPGHSFALPDARIDAVYAGGTLAIERLELHGAVDATVSGTLAARVSLVRGVGVDRDAALALDVRIQPSDARLGGYWSRLPVLEGRLGGDVTVRGTLGAPRFGGEIALADGVVQVAGMVERFENASARVAFVDNVVRLASFETKSSRGGVVNASGSVMMAGWKPESYRVDMLLRDFWLASIPDLESLQDGQLSVSSTEWADGRRIPNVTGKVTVKEATLTHVLETDASTRSSVALPTSAPGWICSIDIDAPKNVWIRDPDLRMELGGQLILKRDETGLYLRGELNVLRGQYTVYGNKFRIIDGSLNFSTAQFRPEIRINADTPHRTEGGFERRIYLSLSWPHDQKEPTVTLSYDEPGYYESDIWRMLGGSDIAGGLAANTLERVLNAQMSDVSIEIEQREARRESQQETAEQEMMIGVGKYLWQDVYLRYRQGLTLSTSREVEVEYRLSNMLLLRSELVRYTRRSYVGVNRQTLDEFNLDIRLRWEF